MSYRDWSFFFTVGLVLVFGLILSGLLNNSRERDRGYDAAKEQYDSAYERSAPPAVRSQSLVSDIEAYRQEWREEQDLRAQRDMAQWAWLMMVASFAGVGITAVGIVFVAQTLVTTRAAVDAANRTADEAKRIGEAQVRAYMSISNVSIIFVSDNGKIVPGIEMKIGNSGNSPARNFEMHMQLAYQTIFFDGDIAQEVFLMTENWGPFVSKDERPFSFLFREGPLGQKYIDEMQQRGWPLVVHVTINTSFVDVFDIPIKDSQTFSASFGKTDEISQRKTMKLSPVTIDQLVASAKHMTVMYSEHESDGHERNA